MMTTTSIFFYLLVVSSGVLASSSVLASSFGGVSRGGFAGIQPSTRTTTSADYGSLFGIPRGGGLFGGGKDNSDDKK